MCTVSWLRRPDGFELFCNRDERRTRAVALAPTVRERGAVRYVAPTDGDFGGTWLAANEHGLALCLLNNYENEATRPRANERTRLHTTERTRQPTSERTRTLTSERSRGLLLDGLIDCRAASSVRARLVASESSELFRYRPFTLLALDMGGASFAARWSRGRLTFDDDPRAPLTSSSFETAAVKASRDELFRRTVLVGGGADVELLENGVGLLEKFHRSHEPARGPFSVCMHRADAATVSFSRVRVREELIEFEYLNAAPCAGGTSMRVTLPRATAETKAITRA